MIDIERVIDNLQKYDDCHKKKNCNYHCESCDYNHNTETVFEDMQIAINSLSAWYRVIKDIVCEMSDCVSTNHWVKGAEMCKEFLEVIDMELANLKIEDGKAFVETINATMPKEDVVNKPSHYNRDGAMESIDEMVAVFGKEVVANFCLCNVWKYRYRAYDKNGLEDIKKSDWYMRKYVELTDHNEEDIPSFM